MNKNEREQLRLLRQYLFTKNRELQKALDLLIEFSREDLKKIDKIAGDLK